jgi:hypothetical protein
MLPHRNGELALSCRKDAAHLDIPALSAAGTEAMSLVACGLTSLHIPLATSEAAFSAGSWAMQVSI